MEFTAQQLFAAFLWSVAVGAGLGAVYEPFRLFHIAGFDRRSHYIVSDILFMLICGAVTFLFSLAAVKGNVRLFIILGEAIGFCGFRFTIGQITEKIYILCVKIIKKLFSNLLKISRKVRYNVFNRVIIVLSSVKEYLNKSIRVIFYGKKGKTGRFRHHGGGSKTRQKHKGSQAGKKKEKL